MLANGEFLGLKSTSIKSLDILGLDFDAYSEFVGSRTADNRNPMKGCYPMRTDGKQRSTAVSVTARRPSTGNGSTDDRRLGWSCWRMLAGRGSFRPD
jgi:hypothetical protein